MGRSCGSRWTALATLLASAFLVVPATAAGATTGRLLVTWDRAPATQAQAPRAHASALRTAGARTIATLPRLRTDVVRPPAGVAPSAFARTLRAVDGVRLVQAERRHELRYQPNDPSLVTPEPRATAPDTPLQWWVQRTGLFTAWDITRGDNARIAVLDTGIDGGHPEFAGRIVGAVDDDASGEGTATTDEIGHGTHVASMACAAGDNGAGLVGAGFACKMLIYKTDLSDSSVARSIVAATDAGVHAINMSFGTDGRQPAAQVIVDAIAYAVRHDVVLVAAAADEPVEEQGDPSNVLQPTGTGADITAGLGLSVTAANFLDKRANFAGMGSQISLAAYGAYNVSGGPRGIFGAFPAQETSLERGSIFTPGCSCRATLDGDSRYAYLQGTSMAAPIVTATAALVRELNPDLKALEVVRLLKETASRPAGSGWNPDLGWGILDAGAAITAARTIDRRAPVSRLRRPAAPRGGRVTLKWTAQDDAPARLQASGLDTIEVWRAANGRKARRVARTRKSSVRLKVARGSRYDFFTIAVDRAGNREREPARADVRVRVAR
jgi:subtilisin family serine protease